MKKKKKKKKINKSNGFTLIELIVVISIIILVTSFVLPRLLLISRMNMHADIEMLYNTINQAQHKALTTNTQQTININVQQHTYAWNENTHTLHHSIRFGFTPGALGPPSSPVQPIHSPSTFKNCKIIFHPDGHIDPGSLYLIALQTQLMYAICIGISQVSFVRTYRFEQGWKQIV